MKERNISLDILRIISMLMVVMLHATLYGIDEMNLSHIEGGGICILRGFSIVAVNVFVLTTGYFMNSQQICYKRLIRLWLQVETYSVGIYLILCMIPSAGVTFRWKRLIGQACPILSYQYWFFAQYFLLYLLAPVLNRLLNGVKKTELEKIIFLLCCIFAVIPTMNIWGDSFAIRNGYGIIWFCVLYLIGAWFRRFFPSYDTKKYGLYGMTLYVVMSILLAILKYFSEGRGDEIIKSLLTRMSSSYNSPMVLMASIFLFSFFCSRRIVLTGKAKQLVVKTAKYSFGVYLLHEHGTFRLILWNNIINLKEVSSVPALFFIKMIFSVFAIFIVSCLIEWLRECIIVVLRKAGRCFIFK